jgi:hypothetical protein
VSEIAKGIERGTTERTVLHNLQSLFLKSRVQTRGCSRSVLYATTITSQFFLSVTYLQPFVGGNKRTPG